MTSTHNDLDDLEALFDSIVLDKSPLLPDKPPEIPPRNIEVINKIGQITRVFHDSLHELGYDKNLEKITRAIPDARDRLHYIATMTQQAAERVLNATDAAQPVVEKLAGEAQYLSAEWQKLFEQKLDTEQFKQLATRTHIYLAEVPLQTKATNAYLTEIMMAQDFQDLTGQVIKKLIEVTQQMEQQLVGLLVENAPPSVKSDTVLLDGSISNAQNCNDTVTNQRQVNELLESLGF